MPGSSDRRRTLRAMPNPRQRGNGDGSVYYVKPAKGKEPRRRPWAAVLTVGWDLEGSPIRKARYESSKRRATALLSEMRQARDAARPMPDDRMTVGKWLREWLASSDERELRRTTIRAYEQSVRLLLPLLGSVPLRRLRSPEIEAALRTMTDGNRSNARAVLSTAIKDAQRAGHVQTNEAALARIKAPRRGLPAPTPADVRAILHELESHRLHALYVLMAGTALRIGEATGLRWEDVDGLEGRAGADLADVAPLREGLRPDHGRVGLHGDGEPGRHNHAGTKITVRYQHQFIDGEHVLTDPKTEASGRIVYLPPQVQSALRSHRARQATERLAAGRKWRQADLVFTSPSGQPVSESTAQWVLSQACKRAKVRHVSPHDLRRFCLTQVEERLGREAAQRLGGHTDPKMTERYVSTTERMLRDVAEALGEAMG